MRVFFCLMILLALTVRTNCFSQTLGGNSGFNFLKLSNTPQLTALGTINISNRTHDVGMFIANPSLIRSDMHGQLQASFNAMVAGIKNFTVAGGYTSERLNTNFGMAINYLDYGTLPQTDAAGNLLGEFHPSDYFIQLTASRKYEEHWQYGASLKFIHSNYGQYRSAALAMDVSASYYDSAQLLQTSLVLKNMGAQLKTFTANNQEELPFDIQLGISKRLLKAPIQFSFTAHHLHRFNLLYKDTTNEDLSSNTGSGIDKIFRHFVFASQFYIDDKIELTLGYNHLARKELSIVNTPNGFTGFSMGIGLITRKLQFRYASTSYQNNGFFHHIGLGVLLF